MARAMHQLGFQKKDLQTHKRRDDFRSTDSDALADVASKHMEKVKQSLVTVDVEEVDEALVALRFKHY